MKNLRIIESKGERKNNSDLFDWVEAEMADAAIIMFGTPTGKLKTENLLTLSRNTHSFISSKIDLDVLIDCFNKAATRIIANTKYNTCAGSLRKCEVVENVEKAYEENYNRSKE